MSTSNNQVTKINLLLANEVNEEVILSLQSKSENKFATCTRYNTLLYDGCEFIICQMFNDDLFKEFNVNDVLSLQKFIAVIAVDDKGFLPLNTKGIKLEFTSTAKVEKTCIIDKIDIVISNLNILKNIEQEKNKLFKSFKAIVLNKQITYPNNKTLVKYDLTNESFEVGIYLVFWSNDVVLDENHVYTFKFVSVEKYNNNLQLSYNTFSKHEIGKKVANIKLKTNFKHLSLNNESTVIISNYEMFHFNSKGMNLRKEFKFLM